MMCFLVIFRCYFDGLFLFMWIFSVFCARLALFPCATSPPVRIHSDFLLHCSVTPTYTCSLFQSSLLFPPLSPQPSPTHSFLVCASCHVHSSLWFPRGSLCFFSLIPLSCCCRANHFSLFKSLSFPLSSFSCVCIPESNLCNHDNSLSSLQFCCQYLNTPTCYFAWTKVLYNTIWEKYMKWIVQTAVWMELQMKMNEQCFLLCCP